LVHLSLKILAAAYWFYRQRLRFGGEMSKKYWSLIVIIGLICFSISCQFLSLKKTASPTATEKVSSTSRPTRTPKATKTAVPLETLEPTIATEVPSGSDGNVIFFDDFSSDINVWPVGNYPGDYADSTYTIESGVYKWSVVSHDTANERVWQDLDPLVNFTVTVDAKQTTSNADDCDYGIIYRQSGDGTLLSFTVSNVDYSVYSYSDADGWVEIIPFTSSSAVMPGAYNQLKVVGSNGYYEFYANDQYLTSLNSSLLTDGQLGMNVDAFSGGLTCEFEFDNFSIATP
jgi:hypothetical protein